MRFMARASKLAIEGGKPVRTKTFAPWPYFPDREILAVQSVLKSGKVNYWTGSQGRLFEAEFAAYTGCKYAVALANGTVALEAALYALDIGPGDEVIVTSRTFVASVSCIVLRGAKPVFADVDPVSQNITADTAAAVLTPHTKAIITVHLAGWPCDMDSILSLARKNGLSVIEDCAQAHGATYKGRKVGSLGDVAAFSFCQDKIISTAGEGGMLTTNDKKIWEKVWSYKDHGKDYSAVHRNPSSPNYNWVHQSIGTNWRLTEIQSAIGRLQLQKLDKWLKIRRQNAQVLNQSFDTIPGLRITVPTRHFGHAYYKYYAFLDPYRFRKGWSRNRILSALCAEGIPCFYGSCSEVYLERGFHTAGIYPPTRLPIARRLGDTSLMFLVHPALSKTDMLDTCAAVDKVMQKAVR
jgi:dTDP-4-amino-4,6-dideoxygalactose transaminase